jgi:endonuclease-3
VRTPPTGEQVDAALAPLDVPERAPLGRDAWEILLGMILSEGAYQGQVARILAVLTEHIVSPQSLARIDHRDLQAALRQLPLYRQKARAVTEAARALVRSHHGQVPRSRDALARLPGVSRAVAATVAAALGAEPCVAALPEVRRVATRLGWSADGAAAGVEHAIEARFPRERWSAISRELLRVGQGWCRRGQPRCARCPLTHVCPTALAARAERSHAPHTN